MQTFMRNGTLAVLAMLACGVFAPEAVAAEPEPRQLVTHVADMFSRYPLSENIQGAAAKLFWGLATISLVWTMGLLILRQDIGEVIMELLRFMVVTGFFYWLLINASEDGGGLGFVNLIVETFFQLPTDVPGDGTFRGNANGILGQGFAVYFNTVKDVSGGDIPDRILGVGLATLILILLACLAAQFLLMLVMAWVLGLAGIFLLGFGGSRWTAPVAISYYKHVLAVGIAILTLSIIGSVGSVLLYEFGPEAEGGLAVRSASAYGNLGMMLGVSVLMLVLGLKVPQLMFTLITRSPLGFFAGTATAAGSAFASGGSAIAASFQRPPEGGGTTGAAHAVMSASSVAAGGDPFHVGTGGDPFGVHRRADPLRHGSAFGRTATAVTPVGDGGEVPGAMPAAVSPHSDGMHSRNRPDYEAEIAAAVSSRNAGRGESSGDSSASEQSSAETRVDQEIHRGGAGDATEVAVPSGPMPGEIAGVQEVNTPTVALGAGMSNDASATQSGRAVAPASARMDTTNAVIDVRQTESVDAADLHERVSTSGVVVDGHTTNVQQNGQRNESYARVAPDQASAKMSTATTEDNLIPGDVGASIASAGAVPVEMTSVLASPMRATDVIKSVHAGGPVPPLSADLATVAAMDPPSADVTVVAEPAPGVATTSLPQRAIQQSNATPANVDMGLVPPDGVSVRHAVTSTAGEMANRGATDVKQAGSAVNAASGHPSAANLAPAETHQRGRRDSAESTASAGSVSADMTGMQEPVVREVVHGAGAWQDVTARYSDAAASVPAPGSAETPSSRLVVQKVDETPADMAVHPMGSIEQSDVSAATSPEKVEAGPDENADQPPRRRRRKRASRPTETHTSPAVEPVLDATPPEDVLPDSESSQDEPA